MSNTKKKEGSIEEKSTIEHVEKDTRPVCGLIMPIADTEGYPKGHWKEVKRILVSVAEECGFRTRLVSESEDVRIIQTTIVQNVFDDDIIICDVSSKNPNVMFELGLRLAFDKAAVIVKDNVTGYSFDTSPVEHINYPQDLRYYDIEKFKTELKAKLLATHKESLKDNHSMYLQSFGKFVVKELQTKEISNSEYVIESLREIKDELRNLRLKGETKVVDDGFRTSSLNTIPYKFLTQMFEAYLTKVGDGGAISAREFYNYIKTLTDLTGDTMPSIRTIYSFYEKQLKNQ